MKTRNMHDLYKIGILCLVSLLLVGVFFYLLSTIEDDEPAQINSDEQQTAPRQPTSTPTSTNSTNATATNTTASGTTRASGTLESGPPSSDAGMEFPVLE